MRKARRDLADPPSRSRQERPLQAALTIGERQDAAALEDLVHGLRDDPDFFVRETVTWALMRLGDRAVDPLIELSRNREPRVRHDAVHALSKIGYGRVAIPIWELLWDDEPAVISKKRRTRSGFSVSAALHRSWLRC